MLCEMTTMANNEYCVIFAGWNDIGYSFLIGGDGKVYEGRGWGIEGGHTCCTYYNRIGHAIAFVGNYVSVLPSTNMRNVAKKLIECGVKRVGTNNSLSSKMVSDMWFPMG